MKQDINNEINLVVDLIVEDDNDVEMTGQTRFHPRNGLTRLEKLKQIKDDLDKELNIQSLMMMKMKLKKQATDALLFILGKD